jgi:hypothetical protein
MFLGSIQNPILIVIDKQQNLSLKIKKRQIIPAHTIQRYWGSEIIPPLILDLGTGYK